MDGPIELKFGVEYRSNLKTFSFKNRGAAPF